MIVVSWEEQRPQNLNSNAGGNSVLTISAIRMPGRVDARLTLVEIVGMSTSMVVGIPSPASFSV